MEEEKATNLDLKRENQNLMDSCDQLVRTRQKLDHDIQTKDQRISCLESQLAQTKKSLEMETNKITQMKIDLEKAQYEVGETKQKLEKIISDQDKKTEYSTHQKMQLEGQNGQIQKLQDEVKSLQSQLERAEQAAFSGSQAAGDNIVGNMRKQLTELEARRKKENEQKDAEIASLQTKFSSESAATNNKWTSLEQEKTKLAANLENQSLASEKHQQALQRTLQEDQGVTDIQLRQLESMVDKLTKERDGRYLK